MATWFPVGQPKKVKTYGNHFGVKLTGILNYETGAVYVQENLQFDASIFHDFLKKVLELFPQGTWVMVLDNAKVHHAVLLKEFLAAHPRLRLLFLPPDSPELNNIESLWKWLKETCINNVFFSKYSHIILAVRKFVD